MEVKPIEPPKKRGPPFRLTEEERATRIKYYNSKRGPQIRKPHNCDICDRVYKGSHYTTHLESEKHKKNLLIKQMSDRLLYSENN